MWSWFLTCTQYLDVALRPFDQVALGRHEMSLLEERLAALAHFCQMRNKVLLRDRKGILAATGVLLEESLCKVNRVSVLETSWQPVEPSSEKGE